MLEQKINQQWFCDYVKAEKNIAADQEHCVLKSIYIDSKITTNAPYNIYSSSPAAHLNYVSLHTKNLSSTCPTPSS